MRRVPVNGVILEYEERGNGEPLILSHCGMVADAFAPLMDQPALSAYRRIRYHRRGYAGSTRGDGPVTIADQAADLAGLIDHLGVERAHIAGHSSSGFIALQLATDRPDLVGTLTLMEPPLGLRLGSPTSQMMVQRHAVNIQRYRGGDLEGAADGFFTAVFGPGYRDVLERALPGGWEQAARDTGMFYDVEFPSMLQWSFGAIEARRITVPVLSLAGGESAPMAGETERLLCQWFPQAETARVAGVNHMLHLRRPELVAGVMRAFLARHPLC